VANPRGDSEASSGDDAETNTAHPILERPTRDRPYLIVLAGASMGEMQRLEKEVTVIGRAEKADLRIIDDGISREHSRVVREANKLVLEDLGSTNGTYCNGVRVVRQVLAEGDKIMIGTNTILKFTFHDQLDDMFQHQLTESALRDPLTKTYNKKFFMDRIQSEFTYSERHRLPLSLLFLDIDRFKTVNDSYGHPVGDFVLQELSVLMAKSLRSDDILARYGGEEFGVVCRGLDLPSAELLAERIRRAVEQHRFEAAGKVIPVTVSIGVARCPDPRLHNASDLLVAADECMYLAKRSGRNRICAQDPAADDEETTDLIDQKN
jgi:diguanylate cyclase (GGDEF)-like protein